jgi:hypothetical protein
MKLRQGQFTIVPKLIQGASFRVVWKMACAGRHLKASCGLERSRWDTEQPVAMGTGRP